MTDLYQKITDLRRKHQAVILAHNYVDGEVQDIADFVGDSLELSIKARDLQAPVIVFCGVSFMAETAKVLSPGSIVLHPVPQAGCPMADMADAAEVEAYRKAHPDTVIVAYVNTTAATKAHVDICCTSANAEKILNSIPADKEVMFLPDQNLAANVSANLGRKVHLWPGYCPTHNRVQPETISRLRAEHPDALLLVHPECTPAVVALADQALSTGGMLRFVRQSDHRRFLIGTEHGIIHRMRKENPEKEFIPVAPLIHCPNMKKITVESIADALEYLSPRVELSPELIERARLPIERMLAL
jgi:quinolinate synthase